MGNNDAVAAFHPPRWRHDHLHSRLICLSTSTTFRNVRLHSPAPSSSSAMPLLIPGQLRVICSSNWSGQAPALARTWRKQLQARPNPTSSRRCSSRLKEARETRYWLRLIAACRPPLVSTVSPLIAECDELVAILTAILRNARTTPDRGR